ncbi:MAG TPA: hypothetical protein VM818_06680 [Vicinamibacterales bacterium]|nr:hypothetical protein [Vicinamibacterales bacterium]
MNAWFADNPWVAWTFLALGAAALVTLLWIWRKGRPFAQGDVFRASRLSTGNRLFPTQVLITPNTVVQYSPSWIGRLEKSIHLAHVSSVKIDTGMLLSDVLIETSGGSDPIRCHGHRNRDASAIKDLVEHYQTQYYRGSGAAGHPPVGPVVSRR